MQSNPFGSRWRLLRALAVCSVLAAAVAQPPQSLGDSPPLSEQPAAPGPQTAPPAAGLEGAALGHAVEPLTFDFQSGLSGWSAGADGTTVVLADGGKLNRAGQVVELQAKDGLSATLRLQRRLDLSPFHSLRFDVLLPETEGQVQCIAYFVDSDDLWYQNWRPITLRSGRWDTVEVEIQPEAASLEPLGHSRPWGLYAARSVKEIGLRVFTDRGLGGNVYLDKIALTPCPPGVRRQEIFNYETSGDKVGQYKKFEVTFELSRSYENPYDPSQVEVRGLFTSPSGKFVAVPGFFYQDYERRTDRKIERLTPAGSPKWKVRFAPTETGPWHFQIQVSDGELLTTPPREFCCVQSEDPGFVRVCASDPRCFEFDNGSFFYPIGHNIPATFNSKAAESLGVTLQYYEGTGAYDRYLDGMSRGMENYARIWLAAWSFGLEWSKMCETPENPNPDAPRWAYEGLGRYNQENAWRFDYVLERAENLGIYIQLALTTFGHFRSDVFEGDWKNSPYNVRNGGTLTEPQEFWSDEPSQEMYQRMVRYVMARWGYASHVAAWEMSNEIDLVTGYPRGNNSADVPKERFIAWHQRCAETIHKYDPNAHLITTNFSAPSLDKDILELPEISFSSTNWYCLDIVDVMRNSIFPNKAALGKPAIMTECGDDFKGSTPAMVERYLHIELWSSYMIPFAGAGMYYWWDFLDERDLYSMFRPLAEFAKGEDRRNTALHMAEGRLSEKEGASAAGLSVLTLQDERSGYFWIFDRGLLRPESAAEFVPRRREGLSLELKGFDPGSYSIEFWDTSRGGRVQELTAQSKDGVVTCTVPAFMSDIAGKIKPAKEDAVAPHAGDTLSP